MKKSAYEQNMDRLLDILNAHYVTIKKIPTGYLVSVEYFGDCSFTLPLDNRDLQLSTSLDKFIGITSPAGFDLIRTTEDYAFWVRDTDHDGTYYNIYFADVYNKLTENKVTVKELYLSTLEAVGIKTKYNKNTNEVYVEYEGRKYDILKDIIKDGD